MSPRHVFRSLLLGLFLCSLLPASADAQRLSTGGMDLRLFRHAVDSKGVASVNGTDIIAHMDYSFGLILDGGFDLLPHDGFENDRKRSVVPEGSEVPAESNQRLTDYVVERLFTGNLMANFGILNYAVVGIQLPILVGQGPDVTLPGYYNEGGVDPNTGVQTGSGGLAYQGLGNMVIHGKVRLLRQERYPIGLAAIVQAGLPTATDDQFGGEPGFTLWPSLVLGWRPVRRFRMNAEVGYRLVTGDGADIELGGKTDPGVLAGTRDNVQANRIASNAAFVRRGDPAPST